MPDTSRDSEGLPAVADVGSQLPQPTAQASGIGPGPRKILDSERRLAILVQARHGMSAEWLLSVYKGLAASAATAREVRGHLRRALEQKR